MNRIEGWLRDGNPGPLAIVVACMIGFVAPRVCAQPVPARSHADRPWASGVSEDEQATALALYVVGNREFVESRFAQALAKYREAILHWDHPAIRYNMAVCLINLDQPLEARDQLEQGLRYGADALGIDAYQQGITYRKLLDAQLARVRVACGESGATITLDGKPLFTGPGEASLFALAGPHQVVAVKPGYETSSVALLLVAGRQTNVDLRLTHEHGTRMVRRWSTWKPWAVVGGGGALLGAGALSYVIAANSFAAYDRGVEWACPAGCDAMMFASLDGLHRTKARAETEQTVAFSLFVAGGVATIAGAIAVMMNQPRLQGEAGRAAPVVTPNAGGATVALRWAY